MDSDAAAADAATDAAAALDRLQISDDANTNDAAESPAAS